MAKEGYDISLSPFPFFVISLFMLAILLRLHLCPLFSIKKRKREKKERGEEREKRGEAVRREDPMGYSLGEICLNCSFKLRPSWPPSSSPNSILYDCRFRGPHTR